MKIVLLSLLYLIGLPAWATEDGNCDVNYYEINGKRTCLLLVGVESKTVPPKNIATNVDEPSVVEEDDALQAVNPDVSDIGPDP